MIKKAIREKLDEKEFLIDYIKSLHDIYLDLVADRAGKATLKLIRDLIDKNEAKLKELI